MATSLRVRPRPLTGLAVADALTTGPIAQSAVNAGRTRLRGEWSRPSWQRRHSLARSLEVDSQLQAALGKMGHQARTTRPPPMRSRISAPRTVASRPRSLKAQATPRSRSRRTRATPWKLKTARSQSMPCKGSRTACKKCGPLIMRWSPRSRCSSTPLRKTG